MTTQSEPFISFAGTANLGLCFSFSRRLETVNFYAALRIVLPRGWDTAVQTAAFDMLQGRNSGSVSPTVRKSVNVAYPQVLPAILAVVEAQLQEIIRTEASADSSSKRQL